MNKRLRAKDLYFYLAIASKSDAITSTTNSFTKTFFLIKKLKGYFRVQYKSSSDAADL